MAGPVLASTNARPLRWFLAVVAGHTTAIHRKGWVGVEHHRRWTGRRPCVRNAMSIRWGATPPPPRSAPRF